MRSVMFRRAALMGLGLLAILIPIFGAGAPQNPIAVPTTGPSPDGFGLIRNAPGAHQGYTLVSPLTSTAVYLVDMQGRVVHTWETGLLPGAYGYLLENGQYSASRSLRIATPMFAIARRRVILFDS